MATTGIPRRMMLEAAQGCLSKVVAFWRQGDTITRLEVRDIEPLTAAVAAVALALLAMIEEKE